MHSVKKFLTTTIFLSSMTMSVSSNVMAIDEGVALLSSSAAGVGVLSTVNPGAGVMAGVVSLLVAERIVGQIFYQGVDDDLLELAIKGESESSLLPGFLSAVRRQSEEIENKTDVDIRELSDSDLASFLLSPVEE